MVSSTTRLALASERRVRYAAELLGGAARFVAWALAVLSLFAVVCAVATVSLLSSVSQDEVARLVSPSGDVEAVLVETNGGATTSFGYRVLLTRRGWHWRTGEEVAFLYGAVRSQGAYGVNLVWESERTLSVQYLDARREDLLEPTIGVAGSTFTVLLRPNTADETAPPGGMLYNIEGRPHDS